MTDTRIDTLFWDVDETLLDFPVCERNALRGALEKNRLPFREEMHPWYHARNLALWKQYEKGEISRETVLYSRFEDLFRQYQLSGIDVVSFEEDYVDALAKEHCLIPGTLETLAARYGRCRMYIVTNGVAKSQHQRLRDSEIDRYMDGIFISEEIGCQKPQRAFFDACLAQIGNPDRQRVMIIGDSLTSDIRGGNNAGIKTCWYNPKGLPCTEPVQIDVEIRSLRELLPLLAK